MQRVRGAGETAMLVPARIGLLARPGKPPARAITLTGAITPRRRDKSDRGTKVRGDLPPRAITLADAITPRRRDKGNKWGTIVRGVIWT
jgi:hypothetical protein